MTLEKWVQAVAMAAVLAGGGVLGYTNLPDRSGEALPAGIARVSVLNGASEGSADARVAVMEFSDFQCPFCRQFALSEQPELKQRYVATGRVRWIFRHLPLEGLHPFALPAAMRAECARQQGQFWEFHDRLFAAPSLNRSALEEVSAGLTLDRMRFAACLSNAGTIIAEETADAGRLGVRGTPAFLLGRVTGDEMEVADRLSGAVPAEAFAAILDKLLTAR